MVTVKERILKLQRKIHSVFVDFFASGLTNTHDIELIRKVNIMNAIAVISIAALIPLGIDAFRLGNKIVGFSDILVAFILVSGMLYLRRGKNFRVIIDISLFSAGCLFFMLLVLNWENGAGYLWYFIFPLLTSFLLGSKKGFLSALLLITGTFLFFIAAENIHVHFNKSWGYRIRFFAAYGVVTILAYAFEKTREKTHSLVAQKNAQLSTQINELEQLKSKLQTANKTLETRIMERTADLTEINRKLDMQIKEREVLLKEIHHRVKNNLQVISSLLYLQSQKIKDKQTASYFLDSRNRVLSMAIVHENLYQSDNVAQINMKNYVKSLITELISAFTTTEYSIVPELNIEPIPLTIEKAIPMGLIINELVSNSLKYAFSEFNKKETPPSIIISFTKQGQRKGKLVIADNGKGLKNLTTLENVSTLGLTLVRSLIEQLDGTAIVQESPGTRFEIIFEIQEKMETEQS